MSRTEELTTRLLDGLLTDQEADELLRLVTTNSTAEQDYLRLIELEVSLRGQRVDLNLSTEVLEQIRRQRAERTTIGVMQTLHQRPTPAWASRRVTRLQLLASFAVAIVLVLGGLMVPVGQPPQPIIVQNRPDQATELPVNAARLTAMAGMVEVVGVGGPVPITAGDTLPPGWTIRTVDSDSIAVVEFPDRTWFELYPETTLRFTNPGDLARPRRLDLLEGHITAEIGVIPTVVGSGPGEVLARSGQFSLQSAGPATARIELDEGDLSLTRNGMTEPMALESGRAAYFEAVAGSVRLDPAYQIETTPGETLDVPGLTTAVFAKDGEEIWAATTQHWLRWRPGHAAGGPSLLRQVFAPGYVNAGPFTCFSQDRTTLVTDRVREPNTLNILDLRRGTLRGQLPITIREFRRGSVAPDGSWVATISDKPGTRLTLWDSDTGRPRYFREFDRTIDFVAPTPDGRSLAVAQTDRSRQRNNQVVLIDLQTGVNRLVYTTGLRQVTVMSFSPDGRFLAIGACGIIQIWDVPEGRLIRTIDGFERTVYRLAWDAATDRVAAGMSDGQVWLWQMDCGQLLQVVRAGPRGVRGVAFNSQGTKLVTVAGDAPLAVWDAAPAVESAID